MTFKPSRNKFLPLLLIWIMEIAVIVSGDFNKRDMVGTYAMDKHSRNDTTGITNLLKKLGYNNEFIKGFIGSKSGNFEVNIEGSEEANPKEVEIITEVSVLPVAGHFHSNKYKVGKTVDGTFYDGRKCKGTLFLPNGWEEIKLFQDVDGKFECEITYSFSFMKCFVHYKWKELKTEEIFELVQHFDKIEEHGEFSHQLRHH